MTKRWNEEEVAFLHKHSATMSAREIAAALDRPFLGTSAKMRSLGLERPEQRVWSESEFSFLREHYSETTAEEMARALGRSVESTRVKLTTLKIGKSDYWWTQDKLDYIRANYSSQPASEIAKHLNLSVSAITNKAQKMGLTSYLRLGTSSTRHDYFSVIDTPTKAYLLGLYAADGNVRSDSPQIKLSLHAKDVELVELARDEISPDTRIYVDGTRRAFAFTSRQAADDMARWGVTPRKSLTLKWPEGLPDDMERLFLLGYFDGDGCLCFQRGTYPLWSIVGTKEFIVSTISLIEKSLNVKIDGPRQSYNARCYYAQTWGKKAAIVDEWLHSSGLGLARKNLVLRLAQGAGR